MLRQRARTMDAAALASSLGRTPMDVRARALALGIELKGEADVMDRPWGSGEASFLRQQYRRMTPAEIGRQLGRSESAVRRRIESMGLRKKQARPEQASLPMESGPVPPAEPEREALPGPVPESAPVPEVQAPAEAPERPQDAREEAEPVLAKAGGPERASGVQRPFRWWTADEDERLRQFVKDKVPLPELAELFGRGEEEVRRRILRVCAEPDPAVQAQNQKWGFKAKKPKAKAQASGPIPEDRLESMSKIDVLRALAGLA
jgi:hypothetical protein